jgi:hypothetical protein
MHPEACRRLHQEGLNCAASPPAIICGGTGQYKRLVRQNPHRERGAGRHCGKRNVPRCRRFSALAHLRNRHQGASGNEQPPFQAARRSGGDTRRLNTRQTPNRKQRREVGTWGVRGRVSTLYKNNMMMIFFSNNRKHVPIRPHTPAFPASEPQSRSLASRLWQTGKACLSSESPRKQHQEKNSYERR